MSSWDNHIKSAMKTLLVSCSVAAPVAFALVPTPAVAGSLFFAIAFATIFAGDYLRVIKPLAPRAAVVPFPRAPRAESNCELAA
jgi:hypothetical protein